MIYPISTLCGWAFDPPIHSKGKTFYPDENAALLLAIASNYCYSSPKLKKSQRNMLKECKIRFFFLILFW
jgi:hypothetical protein